MTRTLLALTLAAFTSAAFAADPPPTAATKEKPVADKLELTGTYVITSGERGGKPIPPERIEGALVTFTDKKVLGTDKDKKEFFSSTYTVDQTKTPWTITMTSTTEAKESTSTVGLIKKDENMVTVVYALPGGKPPTEFKAGENQHLFVMKLTTKKEELKDPKK